MATPAKKKSRLGMWILVAMVLGLIAGHVAHQLAPDPEAAKSISGYFSILADLFLRLIKMIIAPLVFSTLVVGMTKGKGRGAGRLGLKAMGWFITASVVSLFLGLFFVNLLQPGRNLSLPLPDVGASTNLKTSALSLKTFVTRRSASRS